MTRDEADRFLRRLAHSALAADAMMPLNFRNESDLTPEERERGERWRRFRDQPRLTAAFVLTGGKTKAEIVRDVARAMRRAGLLKETPRKSRCPIGRRRSNPSREAHPSRDFRLRSEVK
jgi:hypothetical protein